MHVLVRRSQYNVKKKNLKIRMECKKVANAFKFITYDALNYTLNPEYVRVDNKKILDFFF
jgi:hypothetical protein